MDFFFPEKTIGPEDIDIAMIQTLTGYVSG
jgi:hypothetical protein